MEPFEDHRRGFRRWRRALAGAAAFAVLAAPYLLQGRSPAAFWTALVVVGLFATWAGGRAGWHYWLSRGGR